MTWDLKKPQALPPYRLWDSEQFKALPHIGCGTKKNSDHHPIYWICDLEERTTERSEVQVIVYSIDALRLVRIPRSPLIETLALYIISETWENSELPSYVGSET